MAMSNQSNIDIGIDHEKLAQIRDTEFPDTVRRHGRASSRVSSAVDSLSPEEIEAILRIEPVSQQQTATKKTQFYDSKMRRI